LKCYEARPHSAIAALWRSFHCPRNTVQPFAAYMTMLRFAQTDYFSKLPVLFVCLWFSWSDSSAVPLKFNRVAIQARSLAATSDALTQWRSLDCRMFYDPDQYTSARKKRDFDGVLTTFDRVTALEDLHFGGRIQAIRQYLPAQEVVVSDRYKFGFVVLRKNAGAAIMKVLADVFGARADWCLEKCRDVPVCFVKGTARVSTSLHLTRV
jgi:hypothetical protein